MLVNTSGVKHLSGSKVDCKGTSGLKSEASVSQDDSVFENLFSFQNEWDSQVGQFSYTDSTVLLGDEIIKTATLFCKVFVVRFIQELGDLSKEAQPGSRVEKRSKIARQLSNVSDIVPSSFVSGVFDILSSRSHLKKAKGVYAASSDLRRGDDMKKLLMEAALEIVKSFEEQFAKIFDPNDFFWRANVEKLAVDAVFRAINYLAHHREKRETQSPVSYLTKSIILGKSKMGVVKRTLKATAGLLNLGDFKGGYRITTEEGNLVCLTSELYSKAGIKIVEDGTVKYYKPKRASGGREYGYRLALGWEINNWEDIKHEYLPVEESVGEYVSVLTKEVCERLIDNLLLKLSGNSLARGKDINALSKRIDGLSMQIDDITIGMDRAPFFFNLGYPPKFQVRRERLLEELAEKLTGENQGLGVSGVVSIVGKHGTGKSHLAKFYGRSGDFTRVILIDCRTYESFSSSIIKLAEELEIPTEKSPSKTVVQDIDIESLIKSIYRRLRNAKNLFIFDNLANYSQIKKFLPCTFPEVFLGKRSPAVLITSCNKNLGWDNDMETIDLDDGFSMGEAISFIEMALKTNGKLHNPHITTLIEVLNYLPLALVQAASHIREKELSISDYLERYSRAIQFSVPGILEEQAISSQLYAALKVNFDEIRGEKSIGEQSYSILHSMAYLDPNQINIREALLQEESKITNQQLSSALFLLSKFSIIKLEESLVRINEGVQKIIREEMREGREQGEKEGALRQVMVSLGSTSSEHHITSAWSYTCKDKDLTDEFIPCTYNGSTILHLLAKHGNDELIQMILERVDSNKLSTLINSFDKKDFAPLQYAAINGHLEIAKCLVRKGANVNLESKNGLTPMHLAVIGCHFKTIMYLKEEGADVNLKEKLGITPLHIAVASGNLEIVKYLKQIGGSINLKDGGGRNCMHIAAARGKSEIVKYLRRFIDINLRDNHYMASIHWAALSGNLETIGYLIQEGVDINLRDKNGMSCLHWIVARGNLGVVKCLIQKGADVNIQDENGLTPMHFAAFNGDLEIVKYLKENSADVSLQNKGGIIPMHWASLSGNLEVVKYLEENGADVRSMHWASLSDDLETAKYLEKRIAGVGLKDKNTIENMYWIPGSSDLNALRYITYTVLCANASSLRQPLFTENCVRFMQLAVKSRSLNIVKYFVEEMGADINLRDKSGMTCLHWAARIRGLSIVKYFVEEMGADINLKDKSGMTPVLCAFRSCSLEIIKYLVGRGANINLHDENGVAPIHWAAANYDLETVKYLKENGADINLKDKSGMTPIHWAARAHSSKAVEYLAEVGGDINLQDRSGNSPMHYIITFASSKVVKYFVEEMGADINLKDKSGMTPIHWAAKCGILSVFRYLVEGKGADVNQQDKRGMSPMHWAAKCARFNIIKYLLGKSADISLKDENGMDVFDYPFSVLSSKSSCQELIWYLKQAYPSQVESRKRSLKELDQLPPPKKGKFENISVPSEKNILGIQLPQCVQDNLDMLSGMSVKCRGVSGQVGNMVDEIVLSSLDNAAVETVFELGKKQSVRIV